MQKKAPNRKQMDVTHFLRTGALFLGVVGLIAAGVLTSMSADVRQQAAGFGGVNTYEKCDYSSVGGNTKPVCLDSEPTYGNCVMCVNGEKHIMPNSDCAPSICAAPQPKTCTTNGKDIIPEGETACRGTTECVKCTSGAWQTTDRLDCAGKTCGLSIYERSCDPAYEHTYCDDQDKAVVKCGKDGKWHTYRTCGPKAECEFMPNGGNSCVAIVNQNDAGKPCNSKTSGTRCASDRSAVMTCSGGKWKVKESCQKDWMCFFGDSIPACTPPGKG